MRLMVLSLMLLLFCRRNIRRLPVSWGCYWMFFIVNCHDCHDCCSLLFIHFSLCSPFVFTRANTVWIACVLHPQPIICSVLSSDKEAGDDKKGEQQEERQKQRHDVTFKVEYMDRLLRKPVFIVMHGMTRSTSRIKNRIIMIAMSWDLSASKGALKQHVIYSQERVTWWDYDVCGASSKEERQTSLRKSQVVIWRERERERESSFSDMHSKSGCEVDINEISFPVLFNASFFTSFFPLIRVITSLFSGQIMPVDRHRNDIYTLILCITASESQSWSQVFPVFLNQTEASFMDSQRRKQHVLTVKKN